MLVARTPPLSSWFLRELFVSFFYFRFSREPDVFLGHLAVRPWSRAVLLPPTRSDWTTPVFLCMSCPPSRCWLSWSHGQGGYALAAVLGQASPANPFFPLESVLSTFRYSSTARDGILPTIRPQQGPVPAKAPVGTTETPTTTARAAVFAARLPEINPATVTGGLFCGGIGPPSQKERRVCLSWPSVGVRRTRRQQWPLPAPGSSPNWPRQSTFLPFSLGLSISVSALPSCSPRAFPRSFLSSVPSFLLRSPSHSPPTASYYAVARSCLSLLPSPSSSGPENEIDRRI